MVAQRNRKCLGYLFAIDQLLAAAIIEREIEFRGQPVITERPAHPMPFPAITVRKIRFGAGQQVLRHDRSPKAYIELVLIGDFRRVETPGRPTVRIEQVQPFAVTLHPVRRIDRPRKPNRIEVDYIPFPARRIDNVLRQTGISDTLHRIAVHTLVRKTVTTERIRRHVQFITARYGSRGRNRTVTRGRHPELLASGQIVHMHFVIARRDRIES